MIKKPKDIFPVLTVLSVIIPLFVIFVSFGVNNKALKSIYLDILLFLSHFEIHT